MIRARSRDGFTVVEIFVGMAITAVILGVTLNTILSANKQSNQSMKDMLSVADQVIADRQLWFDLRTISSSFNSLNVPDDNGQNFFDYASDSQCTSNCTRSFTLGYDNNAEMVFIAGEDSVAPPVMYDPVGAYNATPGPNFNVAGTLTFMGLNYKPAAQPEGTMELLYPPANYPEFWAPAKRLLLLYSPIVMREAPGGVPNMAKHPRGSYVLVNYDLRDDLNAAPALVTLGGRTISSHPSDASVDIDSVDKFFRTLPPVGGSVGLSFVKPVMALRYQVVAINDPDAPGGQSGQLRRSVWDANAGTWGSSQTISEGLKNVIFCRSSISLPAIAAAMNPAKAMGMAAKGGTPTAKTCADLR